ncbi:hypothetical protein GO684_03310 [Wolbachia endosymbiont of Litomosoides brasiliensis]|nr:hypothetical protein [Wolbachia endosymbiont of Litomosoides brasiliensis]NUY39680.1 hypothetical protein [Wolbachia endosymbiont of Litomosoides brasiliensis]
MLQKTKRCNCNKKHNIIAVAKICCISGNTNCMGKAPKIWKRKKLFVLSQHHRKTRLNQESI